LNDVFGAYGLVLRAEYTNLSPKSSPVAWYSHSLWSMTHYGRVFGHHAGTDSDDLFIEISHAVNDTFRYRVGFDRERGGISQEYPEEKYQFFIETGFDPRKWCNLTIRYGYEEITNVGNVEDAKEKNHFIGTELKFRF
jgi:hypothetical protein